MARDIVRIEYLDGAANKRTANARIDVGDDDSVAIELVRGDSPLISTMRVVERFTVPEVGDLMATYRGKERYVYRVTSVRPSMAEIWHATLRLDDGREPEEVEYAQMYNGVWGINSVAVIRKLFFQHEEEFDYPRMAEKLEG